MKHCSNCDHLIPDSAAYCQFCGQPQESLLPPPQPTWRRLAEDDPGRTQPLRRAGPPPGPVPSQIPIYPTVPPPVPPPTTRRPGWDSNRTYRVLLMVLGVMFVCAAALAVITLWTASTDGANRLINQVENIFQAPLSPANEAPPTETPLPPTPTPWPTFTPAPTGVPPAEEQPGEDAGFQILSPACAAALDHLERVSDTFTQSPTTVFDADWRAETRQALDEVKAACGSLDSASPVPGQVAEVQRLLALTSQTYDDANRLLKEGIDEPNLGKIWQAVQQFTQAIKYLNETLAALRAVGH